MIWDVLTDESKVKVASFDKAHKISHVFWNEYFYFKHFDSLMLWTLVLFSGILSVILKMISLSEIGQLEY